MAVRYNSIEVRRYAPAISGQVNINNNSTVTNVDEVDGKLSVGFVFSSSYEPNIGLIRMEGELLVTESKENVERALDEWKKTGKKNLPEDIAEKTHNAILSNCIVEATILSREVQLPPPIPTPQVKMGKGDGDAGVDTQSYIR